MRRRVPGRGSQPAAPRVRPARRGTVRGKEDPPKNAVGRSGRRREGRIEVIDISRRIAEDTPVWRGDVPFSSRSTASLAEGSPYESVCFTMSAHLATHVDAPAHVLRNGAAVGELPLEAFFGLARVVGLPGRGETGPDALPRKCLGVSRILFRTGGVSFLSPLAALRLAERGAILVGTDAASIDPEDAEDLPAHRALLSRSVALLENLDLERVEDGRYELVALPLKFAALDASPVRAVLIRR